MNGRETHGRPTGDCGALRAGSQRRKSISTEINQPMRLTVDRQDLIENGCIKSASIVRRLPTHFFHWRPIIVPSEVLVHVRPIFRIVTPKNILPESQIPRSGTSGRSEQVYQYSSAVSCPSCPTVYKPARNFKTTMAFASLKYFA